MSPADDSDSLITLKLYREQEAVLWAHKVPLKPATIRLVDSDTFWGRWDPETRTISISRRLVTEHSWFSVQAILRHEMAHQYASEFHKNSSHTHDEVFRECCERLGVPEEFSGATASLQAHALDWKTQQHGEKIDKLLVKVRKLLALATSSNEHEALLAMEKVREIYARHNLDESLLRSVHDAQSGRVHLIICHKKKRIEAHQAKVCGILVGHFFVRVIHCKEFDPQTGELYQAMQLVGSRENVLMAEYVYHFLLGQTDFLLRELKKRRGGVTRFESKSYRLGVLQGFADKLREFDNVSMRKYEQAMAAGGEYDAAAAMGKALSVLSGDVSLDHYLETVYPRLSNRSSNTQYVDGDVYASGAVAGAKIRLYRGISTQGGNSAGFWGIKSKGDSVSHGSANKKPRAGARGFDIKKDRAA